MTVKKLIEVALPLEEINAECAREKSIRHGHPSTLHLWWARRPLAAARAVIWASLVDDPSSHPEKFPTEQAQDAERERLFGILKKLVVWENSGDEEIVKAAKEEIKKSVGGDPPEFLDPFAGGGAIPLEAQRLGLKAHAHDLNPVAVMINKAMIEIPPRFSGKPPVNPQSRAEFQLGSWDGARGLAEDVLYYGEWMRAEAFKRVGHLYPKVKVPVEQGGGEATVIAWIWARTVKCPNPACGHEMPLASSFVLSKKKGKEAWSKPVPEGGHVRFEVRQEKCPKEYENYKTGRGATFKCPYCGEVTTDEYVKAEGCAKRIGSQLMAVVAEGEHRRIYCAPDEEQFHAAHVKRLTQALLGSLPENPRWFSPPAFGMTEYVDLFTSRQLAALTTFSDFVAEARERAEADAVAAGLPNDGVPLCEGGAGARAYGEAVGVYLAFTVDRLVDRCSSFCSWDSGYTKIRNTFGRQAIPMVWDYAEGNPFSSSTGSFSSMIEWVVKCLLQFPASPQAEAAQVDVKSDCGLRNVVISTDPPYYDNIGYADLSDFFYVWLRRALKDTYPRLFATVLVPKADELIATPYRHGGSAQEAKSFFERGMRSACERMYACARDDVPVTIYYAYKQSDTDADGTASSGWETMLSAIVDAGFVITGTWPMRTEMENRSVASGTNALASSIVLVCRKRPEDAPDATRGNLVRTLRRELRSALKKLLSSDIAPVDLAQSAIGPCMAVFSRYSRVLGADGAPMSVRDALRLINSEIDAYFNEQAGELDAASRFCVDLYEQCGHGSARYGEAEVLATAKSVSIPALSKRGIVFSGGGSVRLLGRDELPDAPDAEPCVWTLAQRLALAMERGGVESCAAVVASLSASDAERAKDLAYRLYTTAERKGWTADARAFNALVAAWPDVAKRAAELMKRPAEQINLF